MLNLNIEKIIWDRGTSVLAYVLNEMIQQLETNVPKNIFFHGYYDELSAYAIKSAEAKEKFLNGDDDPESVGELLLHFQINNAQLSAVIQEKDVAYDLSCTKKFTFETTNDLLLFMSKYAAKEKVRALFV